jgi:hypothetical protein
MSASAVVWLQFHLWKTEIAAPELARSFHPFYPHPHSFVNLLPHDNSSITRAFSRVTMFFNLKYTVLSLLVAASTAVAQNANVSRVIREISNFSPSVSRPRELL